MITLGHRPQNHTHIGHSGVIKAQTDRPDIKGNILVPTLGFFFSFLISQMPFFPSGIEEQFRNHTFQNKFIVRPKYPHPLLPKLVLCYYPTINITFSIHSEASTQFVYFMSGAKGSHHDYDNPPHHNKRDARIPDFLVNELAVGEWVQTGVREKPQM